MVKKSKTQKLLEEASVPFKIGFLSVGAGFLAQGTDSLLPAGVQNPLGSISQSAASAAGISGKIVFTGIALKSLKSLEKLKIKNKGKKLI